MNAARKKQVAMLAIVVMLIVAVLLDRAGAFSPGAAPADSPASARDIYLARAALLKKQRLLVAQSAHWQNAASDARAAWDAIRTRIIREQSRQIAEETLRERVRGIMGPLALDTVSARPVKRSDDDESPVQLIELRVDFSTTNPATAYELIDRLENAPNLLADVSLVELTGPGMKQIPERVEARINVRALAVIEPGV